MVSNCRADSGTIDRFAAVGVERLIDVKVVAARLDLSERMVWKLLGSGRLPQPVRIGRSVKWKTSSIDRFLACGCSMREFDAATAQGAQP